METEVSKVGICESKSFLPSFTSRIKRKGKKWSSRPTAFSNSAVQISPTCLISEKSKALVRIVSISRDGEFIPVIMSSVGKPISNERQPTKKKKQLGFDAAEIKVKTKEPEVCSEELVAKHISEEEDEVAVKMSDRWSWVRIAKAFRFPKAPDFDPNNLNETKVLQNPIRRRHGKDTKTPVIEQHKSKEIRQKKEVADSIPGPIEQPSKSSRTSTAVDSKRSKLWKFINFHRKVNSHGNKRQGIKSAPLSELPRPDINSTTPNSPPKKLNMLAERKGSIRGDATGEIEDYSMAITLAVLIIIIACLAVLSNRLLAVLCTSIWWYLLPSLLKKKKNRCPQQPVLTVADQILNIRDRENLTSVLAMSAVPFSGANTEGTIAIADREGFAEVLWCSGHFNFNGIISFLAFVCTINYVESSVGKAFVMFRWDVNARR